MKIVARSFATEFLPPATLFGPLGHAVRSYRLKKRVVAILSKPSEDPLAVRRGTVLGLLRFGGQILPRHRSCRA